MTEEESRLSQAFFFFFYKSANPIYKDFALMTKALSKVSTSSYYCTEGQVSTPSS
jgi:hypothetical protein